MFYLQSSLAQMHFCHMPIVFVSQLRGLLCTVQNHSLLLETRYSLETLQVYISTKSSINPRDPYKLLTTLSYFHIRMYILRGRRLVVIRTKKASEKAPCVGLNGHSPNQQTVSFCLWPVATLLGRTMGGPADKEKTLQSLRHFVSSHHRALSHLNTSNA